jgi:Guanine nucleotide exchange factor in Golgi transport N-terminal
MPPVSSNHCHVHSIPSSHSYFNTTPSPLLLKTLSSRFAFPLALRDTRVAFLLLKQFPSELETEAKVILTLLIKLIFAETDAG